MASDELTAKIISAVTNYCRHTAVDYREGGPSECCGQCDNIIVDVLAVVEADRSYLREKNRDAWGGLTEAARVNVELADQVVFWRSEARRRSTAGQRALLLQLADEIGDSNDINQYWQGWLREKAAEL